MTDDVTGRGDDVTGERAYGDLRSVVVQVLNPDDDD